MQLSGGAGFLLDRVGRAGEKGDMTFARALGVTAIVATVTLLGVACGDDEMGGTGLSGGSQSAGTNPGSGSSGSGSSGSGGPTTSGSAETTEASPTTGSSAPGETTIEEPETSSGGPATTTTGVPETTTGPETSSTTTGVTTNGAECGNGTIDGNEQCDGANLNGFTCEALGNAGGTLQCDPVTCTFDTQLCEGGGGTSG